MAPRIVRKNKQEGRESVRNVTPPQPKYKTLPKIPQSEIDISTSTDQFKFPTFQEMSDAIARGWYEVGNNPYISMANEEQDPIKKKQLERQAEIYQREMEKNSAEAVKDYDENDQWAATNWLANNLDLFDLATAPVSMGLAPAKVLAKMGPLARAGTEIALQAGLEGGHSALEGENAAVGAVTGGLSGLVPGAPALWNEASVNLRKTIPSIKFNEKQALRREILKQAEPLMKNDKELGKTIKTRLNRVKDGPLMTEADEAAFIDRRIPRDLEYPMLGDLRDEAGRIIDKGFESNLLDDIYETADFLRKSGTVPRGEMRVFNPTQATGEPPILTRLLDMMPEKYDELGRPIYLWSDFVEVLNKWKPNTSAERDLKDHLLYSYLYGAPEELSKQFEKNIVSFPKDRAALMLPREKMFEDYPGLGLYGLQGLYSLPPDIAREALKDMGEGAYETYEGLKGLYDFSNRVQDDYEDIKKTAEDLTNMFK